MAKGFHAVAREPLSLVVSTESHEMSLLREEVARLRRENDELSQLVVRDTLTPLFNRRHFMNCLNDRLYRLERYGTRTALIFMDIDCMKAINDSHGHGAGDFAINHVASVLAQGVRLTDVAARVGGDEFALLLDGVGEDGARAKAAELSQLLAQEKCRFGDIVLSVTISVGCTELRPSDSAFATIARADTAMYDAKRVLAQSISF